MSMPLSHYDPVQLAPYLASSHYINWQHKAVEAKAASLGKGLNREQDKVQACFEFVRDQIQHTGDANQPNLTLVASDVLEQGTGYCFAKSHLLAALLRANGVPTALCYQRLSIEDDPIAPPTEFTLHGLNAVFLAKYGWVRLDARGNKTGVDAQWIAPNEQLAFVPRYDGEQDFAGLYSQPEPTILALYQGKNHSAELRQQWSTHAPLHLSPAPFELNLTNSTLATCTTHLRAD